MLYDPKWEVQTKPDPFSLENLIAWLEKMPAGATYRTLPLSSCLLGQFASAMGADNPAAISFDLGWQQPFTATAFPETANECTFGAALERARAANTAAR